MRLPVPYSPDRPPLIDKGRLYRKRLGGGMRQSGILAAAGLVALEESPAKLVTDHANARFLAEGLARIPGIQVDPAKVETNVVVFDVSASGQRSGRYQRPLAAARRPHERDQRPLCARRNALRCGPRAVRAGAGGVAEALVVTPAATTASAKTS